MKAWHVGNVAPVFFFFVHVSCVHAVVELWRTTVMFVVYLLVVLMARMVQPLLPLILQRVHFRPPT
jgi:hypothetical protein